MDPDDQFGDWFFHDIDEKKGDGGNQCQSNAFPAAVDQLAEEFEGSDKADGRSKRLILPARE